VPLVSACGLALVLEPLVSASFQVLGLVLGLVHLGRSSGRGLVARW